MGTLVGQSLPLLNTGGEKSACTHPPDELAFIEVPGLLIVRLMSRCNNRCRFCMVEEEIDASGDLDAEVVAARVRAQPPGTRIEFFGGEPTIYPHFRQLLALARELGFDCSVATHGRTFASTHFTQRVAELGPEHIYVRTSIYGSDDETHDYYTRREHSYEQTVRGIFNLVNAGFRTQVNVVIMRRNVEQLAAIADQVIAWRVPRIKFGNLVDVANCLEHALPLSEVQPHLAEAIALRGGRVECYRGKDSCLYSVWPPGSSLNRTGDRQLAPTVGRLRGLRQMRRSPMVRRFRS